MFQDNVSRHVYKNKRSKAFQVPLFCHNFAQNPCAITFFENPVDFFF